MATTIYTHAVRTTLAGIEDQVFDITDATTGQANWQAMFWPSAGATKIPVQHAVQYQTVPLPTAPSGKTYAWYSSRLAVDVTISSNVTISHGGRLYSAYNPANATLMFELSKVTSSGGVETLIGSVVEPAVASTETNELTMYTVTLPVATPIALAAGERFILRVFLVPAPGQTMATSGPVNFDFGMHTAGRSALLTFAETFTIISNVTRLQQRRTATIGIANFQDLLTTKITQAALTASMNTVAGGDDLQFQQGANASVFTVASDVGITDTSNLAAYTSGSFLPVVNALYLLGVVHSDAAPEGTHPTISTTTGLNFVEIASVPFDTIASNVHRITVFRAMKPSGLTAGTYTVNFADAGTGCAALLYHATGVVTTGTDGANAAVNVVTNSANATANPNVTFGSLSQSYNGVVVFAATDTSVPSLPSGFQGGEQQTYATPTTNIVGTRVQSPSSLAVSFTSAAQDWAVVGVEVVLNPPPATPTPLEWISPRLSKSWWFGSPDPAVTAVGINQAVGESNLVVKASMKLRLYRWRNGGEVQFYQYYSATELGAIASAVAYSDATRETIADPVDFQPDDRIILRIFAAPVPGQTMGNGSVSIAYDAAATFSPTAWIELYDLPVNPFKAETDPVTPATVPNSGMKMGIQN